MRMTDIVLLAAGDSRRFGTQNKLLLDVNGKPMFTYAVDLAIEAKKRQPSLVGNIIVVSKYPEIAAYVKGKDLIYLENRNSEKGISESIHIGLREANRERSTLFFVCDQPELQQQTLSLLISKFSESKKMAGAIAHSDGEMGNPCVFAPVMRERLMQLTGDVGGKRILREVPDEERLLLFAEESELIDMDCPS